MNVLVLYDDSSTHVPTTAEHVEAFRLHSRHRIYYLPAVGNILGGTPDLSPFDAVLIHYSVRMSIEGYLVPAIARALARYQGFKALFIQDEYEETETSRRAIERLGINAVFTNVPEGSIENVYPRARFPNVAFLPTLTGYVPESGAIERFALPLADRPIMIGYRGRRLAHHYGDLAQEKINIAVEVKRRATEHGMPVDIEFDSERRIYGDDWYAFIGRCRATLGTESGANIFDDDGSLKQLSMQHSQMSYPAFRASFLADREFINMNQISPRIFEAIRLRTPLLLFEGHYSGIIEPERHYIPLRKDFSNLDDALARLEHVDELAAMAERAYHDIIETERFSYKAFVKVIDDYLDQSVTRRSEARIISVPIIVSEAEGSSHAYRAYPLLCDSVLGRHLTHLEFMRLSHFGRYIGTLLWAIVEYAIHQLRHMISASWPGKEFARKLWHLLPRRIRLMVGLSLRY